MPSLIQNYKRKVYSTKLKQTYSILSQAVKLSEIENGSASTWERHPMDNYTDGKLDSEKNATHCYNFFIKYLAPYMKYYASEKNVKNREYRLTNGAYIQLHNGSSMDINVFLNNEWKPGASVHNFGIGSNGLYIGSTWQVNANDRESLKIKCKSSYSNGVYGINNNWAYCTRLLLIDNWEFKDDFPLKL